MYHGDNVKAPKEIFDSIFLYLFLVWASELYEKIPREYQSVLILDTLYRLCNAASYAEALL